ncbi:hypothetical protein [Gardnerella vaginalis]|uniref:DUF4422 domain-containing protein n=2 Tax=Gardnerella vaginalis TaxID=2702 RepID=A0ABD4ZAY4_GARVA|nr:hypothetical protein [Gardnerella vaginalis]MDK6695811.1 hypothetical protein [Gardnerella vaginalis]
MKGTIMTIREKEQRKFRTLLKHMAIHESYEVDIFSWLYCLKYGFDEDEFRYKYDFMEDMIGRYTGANDNAIAEFKLGVNAAVIEKYYEWYEYVTTIPNNSRSDLLSTAADKFCEETLKHEYIPSFLWNFNAKNFMFDAFTAGVVNRVNVYIKSGTLFDGVDAFITMDDKPNFETCKPWDSVTLHDMNKYYAINVAYRSCKYAQKVSENFRKMFKNSDENYDDLISVDSIVSRLLQCQQEGIKSCRKVLQNASEDEGLINDFRHGIEDMPWFPVQSMFWIMFQDYFLRKEK